MTQTGLNDAIGHANDGDTIKFVSTGTITLTGTFEIRKSITLDLNGQTVGLNFPAFTYLSFASGYSVTVKGPSKITPTNIYNSPQR